METPKEFAKEMQNLSDRLDKKLIDKESAHSEADALLCKVLRELGYEKGVTIFESLDLWYS
jgi:hypothetical protein